MHELNKEYNSSLASRLLQESCGLSFGLYSFINLVPANATKQARTRYLLIKIKN